MPRPASRALPAALLAAAALGAPLAAPAPASAQPVVRQDALNLGRPLAAELSDAVSVGWFYTPERSYVLGGVRTLFGAGGEDRAVTLELFVGAPDANGPVRTGTFLSSAARAGLGGALFDGGGWQLAAGTTYFVGFRNVGGLGVNYTDALGAERLTTAAFGFEGDPAYAFVEEADDFGGRDERAFFKPVLEFVGPVQTSVTPEPGMFALVGAGLGAVGVAARRRRA